MIEGVDTTNMTIGVVTAFTLMMIAFAVFVKRRPGATKEVSVK